MIQSQSNYIWNFGNWESDLVICIRRDFVQLKMKVLFLAIVILCYSTVALSLLGLNTRATLKSKILHLGDLTERGLIETPEQRAEMERLFKKLEKLNQNKKSLAAKSLSGTWLLRWTTSDSILGRGKAKRIGPIKQMLDIKGLRAGNAETVDYGLFQLSRKVTAELDPQTPSLTNVYFKQ